MSKTYVYPSDSFDAWKAVTNEHTNHIGDPYQKKSNSYLTSAFLEQTFVTDHVDVIGMVVANVNVGVTVNITNTDAYKLRPGMRVIATVGSVRVSDDLCGIVSMTYSGGGVCVVTLSHALTHSPSPSSVTFSFYSTMISQVNDLEFRKVHRNGDQMTEALTINSNTTATGELKTDEVNFNLVNANATLINFASAATTLNVGAPSGTATVRNSNLDFGQTASGTTNLYSPVVNISNGASGVTTIVSTLNSTSSANGALVVNGGTGLKGTLNVAGVTKLENATDNTLGSLDGATRLSGGLSVAKNITTGSNLRIKGGSLTIEGTPVIQAVTPSAAVGLFNTSTGLITVGLNNSSSMSVNGNVTLNTDSTNTVSVRGNALTTTSTTFALLNATATTLNAFGAATSITFGAGTGNTTFAHDVNLAASKVYTINGTTVLSATALGNGVLASVLTSVGILTNLTVAGNITSQNGILVTSNTTGSLYNTTATTLNIGGAATSVNIGASTGSTTINNTVVSNQYDFGTVGSTTKFAATVATTSLTDLFQLDKTVYRSAEVVVQAKQGSNYTVTKFIIMHDGTDSYETEYGSLGTPLGAYDSNIAANVWSLRVAQLSATSTEYKIIVTAVKV